MNDTPKRKPFFERVKAGLQEAIQFTKGGELNLRSTVVPDAPPQLRAADVFQLRKRLSMSQGIFAMVLNVSVKTVQSWEQGKRRPSLAALRLLQMLQAQPTVFCRVAGLKNLHVKAH